MPAPQGMGWSFHTCSVHGVRSFPDGSAAASVLRPCLVLIWGMLDYTTDAFATYSLTKVVDSDMFSSMLPTRLLAAAACVGAVGLGTLGCASTGPDYSHPGNGDSVGQAPLINVSTMVAATDPSLSRLAGLSAIPGSTDLIGVVAPGQDGKGAGLVRITDTASESPQVVPVRALDTSANYLDTTKRLPQVAAAWSVAAIGNDSLALSIGESYGVLDKFSALASGGEHYGGLRTAIDGAPISPVTGVCSYADNQDLGVFTADGSATLTHRSGFAAGPGDGAGVDVSMLATDYMHERASQSAVAAEDNPRNKPRLTPGAQLSVGGLRSLSCAGSDLAKALNKRGAQVNTGKHATTVAVIDRGLTEQWYLGGVQAGLTADKAAHSQHPAGNHLTGGLVGAPVGDGDHRVDAVAVDAGSGTVAAGLHLDGVAPGAQVGALLLNGSTGWASVVGDDHLYHVSVDKG